jgi:hypothetical protein
MSTKKIKIWKNNKKQNSIGTFALFCSRSSHSILDDYKYIVSTVVLIHSVF